MSAPTKQGKALQIPLLWAGCENSEQGSLRSSPETAPGWATAQALARKTKQEVWRGSTFGLFERKQR